MASSPEDIAIDFSPFLLLYKDGRVHRLMGEDLTPPSLDPQTGVLSIDVPISLETGVSVRIYTPKNPSTPQPQKLPLLIYFHGGGFCIESAFSPTYHTHLNNLVAHANILAVSVDYRRAPEHPLPAAYEDSWAAIQWVAGHAAGAGPEERLNRVADFDRVYVAGDSAGANIAHRMAMRVGVEGLSGVRLRGALLVHPYFWGEKLIGKEEKLEAGTKWMMEELWRMACPGTSGMDDPWINPDCDPDLKGMGGERVAVFVAEKDALRDRGWFYGEGLRRAGWNGAVEVVETKELGHVFHLLDPSCEDAAELIRKFVDFVNKEV